METKKVTKVPAAMEDLSCGKGTTMQERAGMPIEVTNIDMHFAVDKEDDLRKIDINKYRYAKLGELAYRFDELSSVGIPSDFGPGSWSISHLPAKGSKLDSGEDLEIAITSVQEALKNLSDTVGKDKKVFSAKLVKTSSGWELQDKNKVISVQQVQKTGAPESTLVFTFDKAPVTLLSVGNEGYSFDFSISDKELELSFLHNLSGTVDSDGVLVLLQESVWKNIVTADVDASTGAIEITHPSSFVSMLNKESPYYSKGSVNVDEYGTDKQCTNVKYTSGSTLRKLQPLLPLNATVEYATTSDSFVVTSLCLGITAEKGTGTQVVVNHPAIVGQAVATSTSKKFLAHSTPSSTVKSTVQLVDYAGTDIAEFSDESEFYLNNSSLVPAKLGTYKAKYSFDFGKIVVPANSFPVGTSFYLVGLIEA